MAGTMEKSKTVAVTVHKVSADQINVMNQGGPDQSTLKNITVTTLPPATACKDSAGGSLTGCTLDPAPVGGNIQLTGPYGDKTEVTVVGHFNDGSDQVILDTYV
jgi:hypothetical protein